MVPNRGAGVALKIFGRDSKRPGGTPECFKSRDPSLACETIPLVRPSSTRPPGRRRWRSYDSGVAQNDAGVAVALGAEMNRDSPNKPVESALLARPFATD